MSRLLQDLGPAEFVGEMQVNIDQLKGFAVIIGQGSRFFPRRPKMNLGSIEVGLGVDGRFIRSFGIGRPPSKSRITSRVSAKRISIKHRSRTHSRARPQPIRKTVDHFTQCYINLFRQSGNLVVRSRRMGNFTHGNRRHVAGDAVVLRALLKANIGRELAAAVGVTFQATFLIVGYAFGGPWQSVRIVTRYASQFLLAPDVATTLPHLLDMTFRLASFREAGSFSDDSYELL